MGMTIEQAEKLLDDLATLEELRCKSADDASGYTRSGNENIRTSNAKTHEQHAKEYRQILRYLAEYRLMQADYENRLKTDMVAMLTEIQTGINEIEIDLPFGFEPATKTEAFYQGISASEKVIQEKINSLKAENEPQEARKRGVLGE